MARAVWSGSISFGLVNVGVKAYTAVRDHTVHFHQLDKKSGSRIGNQKVAKDSGRKVDPTKIELGYEIAKGRYVRFDPSEIDELRPRSTRSVEVADFVDLAEIDPIFYQSTYWLGPSDDDATRAYRLLAAAMEDTQKVGIGSVVMRNKQYLAAIRPLDGALAMSTMRFADEVVDVADLDDVPTKGAKPAPKELRMAEQLIDSLSSDWKPERYHDTFTEELEKIIKAKDKGKDVVIEDQSEDAGAEVIDLMAALEASVKSRSSSKRTTSTRTTSPRSKRTTSPRTTRKRTTRKAPSKKPATSKRSSGKSTRTKKSA